MPILPLMLQLLVFQDDLLLTHAFRHEALVEEGDHELIFRGVVFDLGCARFRKRMLSHILCAIRNLGLLVTLL